MAALGEKAARRTRNGRRLGIREFDLAVDKAHSGKQAWATVPKELSGFAHVRGAMVVFEKPWPSFRKLPQAAFRGLLRIDGTELVKRIRATYISQSRSREINLPYYKKSQPGVRKSKTQQQLVMELAEEMQASKEFVDECWKSFLSMIARELQKNGEVTLTNVGTLSVAKSRHAKRVTFRSSKALKRKL